MSTKNAATGAGDAGAAQPASPDAIRNVVLVGPAGSGKTTLVEALLAATGTTSRMGSVEEGTTVSDYDEAEIRQQRSLGPGTERRRAAAHRRQPRHADRGDHRGVRGRGADGPLPQRRADRHEAAHRRPRDGGRARLLLPGRPG